VVLEGILAACRYGDMLGALRRDHPTSSYWFYLDVSFAESVRRHHTRPHCEEFTSEQMAEWCQERDLLPGGHETVIDQASSLHATVELIINRVGLMKATLREGESP
jgi:hypothetical protein